MLLIRFVMKKLLIVVVLLAIGAGAYFFLTPSGDPEKSPEAETSKQVGEVARRNDDSSEGNERTSPSSVSMQEESSEMAGDAQEPVSMDEAESVDSSDSAESVAEEITETVVEAATEIEETAVASQDAAEIITADTSDAVMSAEEVAVSESSELSAEVAEVEETVSVATEEVLATDVAANVASTEVMEEIVESELSEQDSEVQAVNEEIETALATAEAMAADIEANSAVVEESATPEVAVDQVTTNAEAELARKLQMLVDQGAISSEQFEMLWTAVAASSGDSSDVSETETPEWLLNPPAVDWDAVNERIDTLHTSGAITDAQYQKFKSNIAKESATAGMVANELTANSASSANNSVSEVTSVSAGSKIAESAKSLGHSGSAYDVRINGYPLPSHLSSDYKFDLVKLFLQKNASGADSYRISINSHPVPSNVDPYVLELLFDLLLSRENSK